MSVSSNIGNVDVTNFTVGAMLRAGISVRKGLRGAESLEEAANMLVRYLYDNCVDAVSGERSCVLTRFYKTHSYAGLQPDLQDIASAQLGNSAPSGDMRCLTLLATAGDEPAWNSGPQHIRRVPCGGGTR